MRGREKEAQREKEERGRVSRGSLPLGFAQGQPGECLCDKRRKAWARARLLHVGQALTGVTTLSEEARKPRSKEQRLQ